MRKHSMPIFILFISYALSLNAADWPQFRGPDGNGHAQGDGYATKWSADQNVKWKAKLPAPGNSSPIVSNGRVFVTCAEDNGKKRSLICFDRTDGKQLWKKTVEFDQVAQTHQTNPYCGSTPAADSSRVVVWHGSAGLYCYGFDGKQLWKRDLGEFKHIWGYGSSPVLLGDHVILNAGPGKKVFMTSIGLADGLTKWTTEEPVEGDGSRNAANKYMGSWSTPIIASIDGKTQIVCTMPTRVNGYDPETGKIVWSCDGIRGQRGDLAYSSPIVGDGFCVATGGYKGPSIGFRPGGSGNVTDKRLWRVDENPQNIGTGVMIDGKIYQAHAGPGTLQCIEAASGKELWQERAAGGNHWGSVIQAGGVLYVTNQRGDTHIFKPNPNKLELIATNPLGEPSNSTPAFSDGQIFIRTFENLYCIDD